MPIRRSAARRTSKASFGFLMRASRVRWPFVQCLQALEFDLHLAVKMPECLAVAIQAHALLPAGEAETARENDRGETQQEQEDGARAEGGHQEGSMIANGSWDKLRSAVADCGADKRAATCGPCRRAR